MKKYLIVTDSTSALSVEEAKKWNIKMAPLNVLIDGVSYEDNIEISTEELYNHIRSGKVPTTSQPSIGLLEEELTKWKAECYDAIIVLTISSGLSGCYNGFLSAKKEIGLDNMYIFDTRSCGAPIKDVAVRAQEMVLEGRELQEILDMIKLKLSDTFSFLYPKDFVQLKKGGRITPAVANVANLLKIKPLLYLGNKGLIVDKYALARTNKKIMSLMIAEFNKQGISSEKHKIYILEADCKDTALACEALMKENFNNIECEIIACPAVLTCQGGLGCLAVQTTLKV